MCQYLLQLLLGLDVVVVWEVLWQNLVKEYSAQGRLAQLTLSIDANWRLQLDSTLVVRQLCLVDRAERLDIISLRLRLVIGQVVVTEHDVLRDVQHWRTVGRLQ